MKRCIHHEFPARESSQPIPSLVLWEAYVSSCLQMLDMVNVCDVEVFLDGLYLGKCRISKHDIGL
jgi:hypothetical protein